MADVSVVAITRLTIADSSRQPVTWLMTALSLVLIGLSAVFGMFNFESADRLRMLCTAGVAVAVVHGLFLGVVLASTTVHDELAQRTALTLFAKPVGRGGFLVGKALGVWLVVAATSLVIAAAHAAVVAWAADSGFEFGGAPGADHHGHDHGGDGDLAVPWLALAVAHLLGLCHAGALATLAAGLAPRLPLALNIVACFAVFVLGHLLAGDSALVVPALALFNVDDRLGRGEAPGASYVLGCGVYAGTYAAACLFLALAAFKRQDLS